MDLRCAVSLPRGIALRWMVILSSTGFTGCGNSASFNSERREESLPIENKRPRGILRANSALRMTVFRFFPQPVFSLCDFDFRAFETAHRLKSVLQNQKSILQIQLVRRSRASTRSGNAH